ncbi:MAG: hypothetical protein HC945_00350 [Nitrosarchaeum sp.]|nr:hypothetical protein [Nitrosarchaeum sp.]
MNIVEILIYFVFAFIIGALVLGLLTGWDYLGAYGRVRDTLLAPKADQFESIERADLLGVLIPFREECLRREGLHRTTLFLEGEGVLSKDTLIADIKTVSLCSSLPSESAGCGVGEAFASIAQKQLPAVLTFTCERGSITVT